MKPKLTLTTLLAFSALGVGCADDTEAKSGPPSLDGLSDTEVDTGDPSEGTDGSGCATGQGSIPDPGDDFAPMRWYTDGGYHGTPETAQTMGILLDVPDYIQGGIDPGTGNYYFVFRTFEDQTEFYVNLFDKTSNIDAVRIFDATGLEKGDEVEPISVSSAVSAEWELKGDNIYLLNVSSPTGGFF